MHFYFNIHLDFFMSYHVGLCLWCCSVASAPQGGSLWLLSLALSRLLVPGRQYTWWTSRCHPLSSCSRHAEGKRRSRRRLHSTPKTPQGAFLLTPPPTAVCHAGATAWPRAFQQLLKTTREPPPLPRSLQRCTFLRAEASWLERSSVTLVGYHCWFPDFQTIRPFCRRATDFWRQLRWGATRCGSSTVPLLVSPALSQGSVCFVTVTPHPKMCLFPRKNAEIAQLVRQRASLQGERRLWKDSRANGWRDKVLVRVCSPPVCLLDLLPAFFWVHLAVAWNKHFSRSAWSLMGKLGTPAEQFEYSSSENYRPLSPQSVLLRKTIVQ